LTTMTTSQGCLISKMIAMRRFKILRRRMILGTVRMRKTQKTRWNRIGRALERHLKQSWKTTMGKDEEGDVAVEGGNREKKRKLKHLPTFASAEE